MSRRLALSMLPLGRQLLRPSAGRLRRPVLLVLSALSFAAHLYSADRTEAELTRARLAAEAGKKVEAMEIVKQALQSSPNSAEAWLALATMEFQGGDPQAIPHFQKALRLAPASFSGHYNLALAYFRQGKLSLALAEFEHAAALRPGNPDAAYNVALVQLELHDPLRAIENLRRVRKTQPERGDVAFNLLRAEIMAGHLAEARDEIASIESSAVPPGTVQDARRILAIAYLNSLHPDLALALLEEPQSAEDHFIRAMALYARKQYASAGPEAVLAAEANPKEARYFVLLGQILQSTGRMDESLYAFRRAAEVAPESVEPLYGMAVTYYFGRDYDEAKARLREVLKRNGKSAKALFLYGIMLTNDGKDTEAVSYLKQASDLEPKNARYRLHLGVAFLRDNRPGDARKCLVDSIRLDPGYGLAHYELGKLLEQLGSSAAALTEFEEAVEKRPDLKQAYYRLGLLAASLGQEDKSQYALARFRALKQQDEAKQLLDDANRELQ